MAEVVSPRPSCSVVLVAAGKGTRFGQDKVWIPVGGRPLWWYPLSRFLAHPAVEEVVFVVHPGRLEEAQGLLGTQPSVRVVAGGAERQDSVRYGVEQAHHRVLLVHDAARAWVSLRVVEALLSHPGDVVVPVLPVPDTLRRLAGETLGEEVDRSGVVRVQTPQKIRKDLYVQALGKAQGRVFRDESTLISETLGLPVHSVPGDERMFKVTYPEDLDRLRALWVSGVRVGSGFDRHRLVPGDGFSLGGIWIPAPYGVEAHSDGDVILHALVDALLGAAGLGDIGEHFPDTDPRWKGADSTVFLQETLSMLHRRGLWVVQVDCTVFLEVVKLKPHKEAIRQHLSRLLNLPPDRVNVKAKTGEKVGPVGRGEAVDAFCSVVVWGMGET